MLISTSWGEDGKMRELISDDSRLDGIERAGELIFQDKDL